MAVLGQVFEIFKAGFSVGRGKWQIDGVPVTASAADLNEAAGVSEFAAVVAAAGANQGNATALTSRRNVVTAADGTKGVRLPVMTAGDSIHVINNNAAVLKVYPSTGATINALAANAAFSLGPGREAIFEASSATQLYSAGIAAGTATVAELNKLAGSGAVVASGTAQANIADLAIGPVTGVDGVGDNAASKADVDAGFDAVETKVNGILASLEAFGINLPS